MKNSFRVNVDSANVYSVTMFKMFTIHVAHPSSIVFELARCDLCNRMEQAAVLFASVEGIHTPIATSKVRVKVGKHKTQIHLL